MQYYVALIADIKGSRKYRAEERGYLQDLTNESLLFANELFKEGIEKEVVFSAGDEVQGLFREPATAFLYYRFLCFLLGPGVLRGGLGVGTWDVRLEEGASTSQDGEAYHYARSAILEAQKRKRFDLVLRSEELPDEVLTTLMDHSLSIGKMRTATRNDMALAVEFFYPVLAAWGCDMFSDNLKTRRKNLLELRMVGASRRRAGSDLFKGLLSSLDDGADSFWEPVRLEVGQRASSFHYLEGDLVGASYALSQRSGMSRQGIDRLLAQGCVAEERNAAALFSYCSMREFRR